MDLLSVLFPAVVNGGGNILRLLVLPSSFSPITVEEAEWCERGSNRWTGCDPDTLWLLFSSEVWGLFITCVWLKSDWLEEPGGFLCSVQLSTDVWIFWSCVTFTDIMCQFRGLWQEELFYQSSASTDLNVKTGCCSSFQTVVRGPLRVIDTPPGGPQKFLFMERKKLIRKVWLSN